MVVDQTKADDVRPMMANRSNTAKERLLALSRGSSPRRGRVELCMLWVVGKMMRRRDL